MNYGLIMMAAARAVSPGYQNFPGIWGRNENPKAVPCGAGAAIGAVLEDGSIVIHYTNPAATATLDPQFSVSDHAAPAVLALKSGRLLAWWNEHNGPTIWQARTTTDPRTWGSKVSLQPQLGSVRYTHVNAVQIDDGTVYMFFRAGIGGDPTTRAFFYTASTDEGETWSAPIQLLRGEGGGRLPPYLRAAVRGGTIDFVCVDPPAQIQGNNGINPTSSLYHFRWYDGEFRDMAGTPLALPIHPANDLSPIWDGEAGGGGAMFNDIAIDGEGHPVIGYYAMPHMSNQRHRYARWNGAVWVDNEIIPAGSWLFSTEPTHSGGLSLDPSDPSRVFACVEIGSYKQIVRLETPDGGNTFVPELLTDVQSDHGAIRPVVVPGGAPEPRLAYLTGPFSSLTSYDTTIHVNDSTDPGQLLPSDPYWDDVVFLASFRGLNGWQHAADFSNFRHELTFRGCSISTLHPNLVGSSVAVSGSLHHGNGVSCGAHPAFLLGSSDFTIDGWIRLESTLTPSADQFLLGVWRTAGNNRSWNLVLNPDGLLQFRGSEDGQGGDSTTNILAFDAAAADVLNKWIYFRVVREGNALSIQIDGEVVDSAVLPYTFFDSSGEMSVGGGFSATSWGGGPNARYEDIRITKAARPGTDVPTAPFLHF